MTKGQRRALSAAFVELTVDPAIRVVTGGHPVLAADAELKLLAGKDQKGGMGTFLAKHPPLFQRH